MSVLSAPHTTARPVSRAASRTGTVLTVLLALFLVVDAVPKLLQMPMVVEATQQMGFDASAVPIIGAVLLVCLVLYLVPRTAILGAVLLTGYLGGAVCAQLRLDADLFTLVFPVVFGLLVWTATLLRSPATRALVKAGR